jgi:hypothetical protein
MFSHEEAKQVCNTVFNVTALVDKRYFECQKFILILNCISLC